MVRLFVLRAVAAGGMAVAASGGLAAAAVSALAAPSAHAPRVQRLARIPATFAGPGRAALPGDYLLANDAIEVVVADIPHAAGYAETGGNVLDVAPAVNHLDALGQIFVYLQGDFTRQALYTRLRTLPATPGGHRATIEVEGHDRDLPDVAIRTRYSLSGTDNFVEMVTTVINRGDSTLAGYRAGDVVQWGMADHFAPGPGRALGGHSLRSPWLAGSAASVAYGYAAPDSVSARHGGTWSNITLATATLAPGDSLTLRRILVATNGDVETARSALAAHGGSAAWAQGRSALRCRLTVSGETPHLEPRAPGKERDAAPAHPRGHQSRARRSRLVPPPSVIEVRDSAGGLVTEAQCAADGKASRLFGYLAPGQYSLRPRAVAHPAAPTLVVPIDGGRALVTAALTLPATGHITLLALDSHTARPIPAKFTFTPRDTTPVPEFGPVWQAAGAAHVIFSADGHAETDILPGRYIITASRGPEYTTWSDTVAVTVDNSLHREFVLRHALDTRGFLGADFHEHSIRSPDSSIPLVDRVISNLAEGVEIAVATDHDNITDYAPHVRRLHATRLLCPVTGNEISTERLGHFIAFPLTPRPGMRGDGALRWGGLTPGQIIDALHALPGRPIVQVNHPRSGRLGYFTQVGLDSQTGAPRGDSMDLRFDALEVFNGKRVDEVEVVVRDWFHLLNRGLTMTATGNSDSHQLVTQEAGYPRNFVWLGTDDPSAVRLDSLVAAVRGHRIVVSNGPMIRFAADDGTALGGTARRRPGAPPLGLTVRVDAVPWVDVATVTLIANGAVLDSARVAPATTPVRFSHTFRVAPAADTWYVIVVRGARGLDPVVPAENGRAVTPFAITNPIWVDADGDGRFTGSTP